MTESYREPSRDSKNDALYHGKTIRGKGGCSFYDNYYVLNHLKSNRKIDQRDENVSYVPVTDADLEFSKLPMNKWTNLYFGLNASHAWKGGKEYLEEISVAKRLNKRRFNSLVTTYAVPIVGHVMIKHVPRSPEMLQLKLGLIKHNNRYYNPQYLHTLTYKGGVAISQYKECLYNSKFVPSTISDDIVALSCKTRSLDSKKVIVNLNPQSHKNGVIIDLLSPTEVTNIGIRGEYPEKISKFPNEFSSPFLPIIESPESLSWVTSYDLYYRTLNCDKKWIKLGNFPANNSMIVEILTELSVHYNTEHGLYTRFLKIVPTNFHISPTFSVAVYGRHPMIHKKTNTNEKQHDIETINFTHNIGTGRRGYYDGTISMGYSGRCEKAYYKKHFGRAIRTKEFFQMLKYDSNDDCADYIDYGDEFDRSFDEDKDDQAIDCTLYISDDEAVEESENSTIESTIDDDDWERVSENFSEDSWIAISDSDL